MGTYSAKIAVEVVNHRGIRESENAHHRYTKPKKRGSSVSEQIYAILKTTYGDITIHLFPKEAPVTVRNFVELAEGTREWTDPVTRQPGSGPFYDGTLFFRIWAGEFIWGGDRRNGLGGGPGYKFDDEIHPSLTFDQPYVLAMANAGTHNGRGTNGSQFFITVKPLPELTGKHTIFGQVTRGTNVVAQISNAPCAPSPPDRPASDIALESVTIQRIQTPPARESRTKRPGWLRRA